MKKKKLSKDRVFDIQSSKNESFFKKNIGLIVVGGIVFLMVFSVFAVSIGRSDDLSSQKEFDYKGHKIINKNGIFYIKDQLDYGFEYSPLDLENIMTIDFKSELSGKVYLAFDPDQFSQDSLELDRIKKFLFSRGLVVSLSCIKEKGCGDLPVVNCNNINKVIYFKNSDKTDITKQDNCIILESKKSEEILIINKFIYAALGVF